MHLIPPVDAQHFRHTAGVSGTMQMAMTAMFVCTYGQDACFGKPLTLSEVEQSAGRVVDYGTMGVALVGEPTLWATPKVADMVASFRSESGSGEGNQIWQLLAQCHSHISSSLSAGNAQLAQAITLLDQLTDCLTSNKKTTSSRKGGGLQYTPRHMLATVLLSDHLKDMSLMPDAVKQSLDLALSDELSRHLDLAGGANIPSKTTLYRFRLELDLCTMVFSRKNYFARSGPSLWACHIRSDASPQFGKDYFCTEIDHVDLQSITDLTRLPDMRQHLSRRILPVQLIGGRAASAAHKALRLMMALGADTEDIDCTLARCYSLAFDMGTERTLFTAPAMRTKAPEATAPGSTVALFESEGVAPAQPLDMIQLSPLEPDADTEDISRLCPRALPIGDYDHEAWSGH